jgi:hypothetical protein
MSARTGFRAGLLVVLVVMVAFGCSSDDDGELPFAPSDCQKTKPATGHLIVEITLNAQNTKVPVKVYVGPIEDGQLVKSDSVSVAQFSYELLADRSYAVTARYLVGQDTILAIGSDDITTSETEYENGFCWEVTDGKVDVRLKL